MIVAGLDTHPRYAQRYPSQVYKSGLSLAFDPLKRDFIRITRLAFVTVPTLLFEQQARFA